MGRASRLKKTPAELTKEKAVERGLTGLGRFAFTHPRLTLGLWACALLIYWLKKQTRADWRRDRAWFRSIVDVAGFEQAEYLDSLTITKKENRK